MCNLGFRTTHLGPDSWHPKPLCHYSLSLRQRDLDSRLLYNSRRVTALTRSYHNHQSDACHSVATEARPSLGNERCDNGSIRLAPLYISIFLPWVGHEASVDPHMLINNLQKGLDNNKSACESGQFNLR